MPAMQREREIKIMKQNHELTPAQEAYRRGNTSLHARRALTAKAILAALKTKPGMTKAEIFDTIGTVSGHGGFELLTRHKLAYSTGSPARWFATGGNPNA